MVSVSGAGFTASSKVIDRATTTGDEFGTGRTDGMLPGSWETLREHVVTWDKDRPKWLRRTASAQRANMWDNDGPGRAPAPTSRLGDIARLHMEKWGEPQR